MLITLALRHIYPDLDLERTVLVVDTGNGPVIKCWGDPRPQPTQAEIEAAYPAALAAAQRAAIPSVSPQQIRRALTRAGLRAAVEGFVAASDQDTKDWWEFATSFERNHPQVVAALVALGVSDAQADDLWLLAYSL